MSNLKDKIITLEAAVTDLSNKVTAFENFSKTQENINFLYEVIVDKLREHTNISIPPINIESPDIIRSIVIVKNNWQHPDKNIRILVPNLLAAEYAGIYAIWSIRELPIERLENDMSYLYCNEIEESFQPVVNALLAQNLIQVDNLQDLIDNYEQA